MNATTSQIATGKAAWRGREGLWMLAWCSMLHHYCPMYSYQAPVVGLRSLRLLVRDGPISNVERAPFSSVRPFFNSVLYDVKAGVEHGIDQG